MRLTCDESCQRLSSIQQAIDLVGSKLRVLILPALLAAAGASWYDPSKAPSIFFLILALGYFIGSSLFNSSKQEAVRNISDGVTHSLVQFSQDPQQSEPLINALSKTLRVALTNDELKTTFRDVAIGAMRDKKLQRDILDTVSGAMVRASENEVLKKVLLSSVEQGFSDAFRNERFVDAIFSATVNAMVSASQNIKLREASLNIITEAVSLAVRDERFMTELKAVLKECLRDGDIYRAGAEGLVGAVLKRSTS